MTYNSLRIHAVTETRRIERGIFVLRLDVSEGHLDCRKLVAANPPPQDLVQSLLGVELPFACLVGERNWERPVVIAEDQGLRAVALQLDRVLGVIGSDEILPDIVVRHGIA